MKTSGTVIWSDQNRGMFKVRCENGRTALVEILDTIDISMGDTITGDLMDYGGDVVLHSSEHMEDFDAMIQDLD